MRLRATVLATAFAAATVLGGASVASADNSGDGATGATANSPGVLSGNLVQVPVKVPVNICGNSVNIVGLLNPTVGNTCANG